VARVIAPIVPPVRSLTLDANPETLPAEGRALDDTRVVLEELITESRR